MQLWAIQKQAGLSTGFQGATKLKVKKYINVMKYNGHSTLFDGVIYNTETGEPRDMLVCETGEEEGVFFAELDVDMLRKYRKCEIGGLKNRRPELYGIITE